MDKKGIMSSIRANQLSAMPAMKIRNKLYQPLELQTECLCNRPKAHVLCRNCGNYEKGRIKFVCPRHPQTVFLYDLTSCSKCHCHFFMLTEV